MTRQTLRTLLLLAAVGLVSACQDEPTAAADTAEPEPVAAAYQSPGKPDLVPVDLRYRLLTTPEVGKPFQLELTIASPVATASLGYTLAAENGLLVDANSASFTVASKPARTPETTVVTLTPAMEGRYYLHVTCNVLVDGRMMTKVVPIAIQVGQGTRTLQQMGEIKTDSEGRPIVVLPAETPEDK